MQLTNDFNLKEIENNVKDYLSKIDLKKIIANSQEKNERIRKAIQYPKNKTLYLSFHSYLV